MGKRNSRAVIITFYLILSVLGILGLFMSGSLNRWVQSLVALAGILFYGLGLAGFLAYSVVSVKDSRWFRKRYRKLAGRKGKTAAERRCRIIAIVLCLIVFALGIGLGICFYALVEKNIRPYWLSPLILITAIALFSAGTAGFIAAIIVSIKNSGWFQRRYGKFENEEERAAVQQNRENILILIGFLCPLIWFLSVKAAACGFSIHSWLEKSLFVLCVFLFLVSGLIGSAAVLTILTSNRRLFKEPASWLQAGLLLLLLMMNIATIFPNSLLTIEMLLVRVLHVHFK